MFARSIPFYVFGALAGFNLTPDLPVSVLMVVVPATAAAILVHRELGSAGVIDLLKRSFDYKTDQAKIWYAPIAGCERRGVFLT